MSDTLNGGGSYRCGKCGNGPVILWPESNMWCQRCGGRYELVAVPPADPNHISERDAVLRERKAFTRGFEMTGGWKFAPMTIEAETNKYYPLPTKRVEIPRVENDPHNGFAQQWRVVDGNLQWRVASYSKKWEHGSDVHVGGVDNCLRVTPQRALLWESLFDNPTVTWDQEEAE